MKAAIPGPGVVVVDALRTLRLVRRERVQVGIAILGRIQWHFSPRRHFLAGRLPLGPPADLLPVQARAMLSFR